MMFIVPGQPASMPRPIFSTRGGFARALTPPNAVSYKAQVLSALRDAMDAGDASRISDGAVEVEISAFFGRPKSHCRKRAPFPGDEPMPWGKDVDNIAKIVLDAMNGWAWRDDSQITQLTVRKIMAAQDAAPRVVVEYRPTTGR